MGTFSFSQRERAVVSDLLFALGNTVERRAMLQRAFPLIRKLVAADQGALSAARTAEARDYEWETAEFPIDWFSAYAEMAPHDFVRQAVALHPNRVLRDSDMLSRRALEQNPMYRRAVELGCRMEHVISMSIGLGPAGEGGLSLYRRRRRPFSAKDAALLQSLIPWLGNAIRNCQLFSNLSLGSNLLESVLQGLGYEAVACTSSAARIAQTAGADALLQRWFSPQERGRGGMPVPLAEALSRAATLDYIGGVPPAEFLRTSVHGDTLRISITRTSLLGRIYWLLILQERRDTSEDWARRLTPREREIAQRIAEGWDNRLIADSLSCGVDNVKKHIYNIFNKTGVSKRTALARLVLKPSGDRSAR